MRLNADEYVDQIRDRVDVLQPAGGDNGLQNREILTGLEIADEEEVFATESNNSEDAFSQIIVERDGGIGQKMLEGGALVLGVGQRLADVRLGSVLADLVEDLAVEFVDELLAVGAANVSMSRSAQLVRGGDGVLDAIKAEDQVQEDLRFRCAEQRVEKLSPRV